jgi:hypothetical protein
METWSEKYIVIDFRYAQLDDWYLDHVYGLPIEWNYTKASEIKHFIVKKIEE